MARLKDVVFDCERAAPLARFWAGVLDGYEVAPYDDAEVERLAALGLTPETDPGVIVEGPSPPRFYFQQVDGRKTSKNRVHVDVVADDRAVEVERLVALGATVHAVYDDWTTLLDPEGNEFCVMDP